MGIRGYSGAFRGYSSFLPFATTQQASYFWGIQIRPSALFIILNKGITISAWAATRATNFKGITISAWAATRATNCENFIYPILAL